MATAKSCRPSSHRAPRQRNGPPATTAVLRVRRCRSTSESDSCSNNNRSRVLALRAPKKWPLNVESLDGQTEASSELKPSENPVHPILQPMYQPNPVHVRRDEATPRVPLSRTTNIGIKGRPPWCWLTLTLTMVMPAIVILPIVLVLPAQQKTMGHTATDVLSDDIAARVDPERTRTARFREINRGETAPA